MKLINPSVTYMPQGNGVEGIHKHIESVARTCYKSEDKITENSADAFIKKLISNKHSAMLEHGTVYLKFFWSGAVCNNCNSTREDEHIDKYIMNPYSYVAYCGNDVYVTTNYRVIVENGWEEDLKFMCEPCKYHTKRYTLKFITDRGVSHELVRHRVFSFAQESTRYCNYSQDRFGNEVSFIIPSWATIEEGHYDLTNEEQINSLDEKNGFLVRALAMSEHQYLYMINTLKLTAQEARQVLPNALKTEICVTGFAIDWRRFFNLRLHGMTGKPHPDMMKVADMAYAALSDAGVIGDIIQD